MSKSILDNLFGSRIRVKILKLLYRQHPVSFTLAELVSRVQEPVFIARREIKLLMDLGMVSRIRGSAKNPDRYVLNPEFDFFNELRDLLLKPAPGETDRLAKRLNTLGRVKLAVVAGIFVSRMGETTYESPADLFLVCDDIDKKKLSSFLKQLESEVGAEIRFGLMEQEEFLYRYEMFDRFIRVLLEGPHRKIINKLDM
jgi:hypothetical protein